MSSGKMKQTRVPHRGKGVQIIDLDPGDDGYVRSDAMFADGDGKLWIDGNSCVEWADPEIYATVYHLLIRYISNRLVFVVKSSTCSDGGQELYKIGGREVRDSSIPVHLVGKLSKRDIEMEQHVEQSIIPHDLVALDRRVQDMRIGECAYITPWDIVTGSDGMMWINGSGRIHYNGGGTTYAKIRRHSEYLIVLDYWSIRREWHHYIRSANDYSLADGYIPVHCNRHGIPIWLKDIVDMILKRYE